MVTWPMILDGHVTCFLETRSRCSTRMWHISVADRDIGKIPKATNSKSGVADRMVTWPMISGGHVTCFLETRSRCSTRTWRISVANGDIGKIPKATNSKSGVADRMVTWPMISRGHVTRFLETRSRCSTRMWHISVADRDIGKIPKATNSKSGVADRMVTWPMISGGHVTCFLETRSRCSTRTWHISVADRDIGKIPKATNSKSGVADRMVTWPMISGGHVTCFLETRSRCSTRTWHISVADGDIGKIPKATNSKSGVADRMVTWPMISGGHVTCFLETRSRCSTRMWRISVADRDTEKFKKRLIANQGAPIGWSRDLWSRVVTWPAFWKLGQGAAQNCGVSDVCGFCNIVTLLSLFRIIKQQILMQKLLRSSKLSCSKPLITLLKQQISNCCTVKKSHRAMLCIAYAQSAYDYARLMWIAVGKQCALPGGIFSRYNNLIFAVLEVWWGAYYNSALNFEEVFALISIITTFSSLYYMNEYRQKQTKLTHCQLLVT